MKTAIYNLLSKLPIETVLIFLAAFIAPIATIMWALGFLVFTDMVLAMWTAYKTGVTITSRKMSATISKGILYMLAIIVAHVVELYLFPIPCVSAVAGLIAMIEVKSMGESFAKLLGYDIFKQLITNLTRKFTNDNKPSGPPENTSDDTPAVS